MKLIGKGSFGRVYRAQRTSDGKDYALKELPIKNMGQRERDEALNEVRLLASAGNEHLIKYYDAFLHSNNLYIVTEFARYGDLKAKVKRHVQRKELMDEDLVWCFFIQAALGVVSLHQRNIIHRDLKTANVFLSSGRGVKLGDLGVAKFAKGGLARTQIGTPYYMAPELWKGRSYDKKADVWSLGCVLYELVSLRHPFDAKDEKGLAEKVMRGNYRPAPASYSQDIHDAIKAMLVVDSIKRPSMQQLLDLPCVQRHLGSADLTRECVQARCSSQAHSPLKATIRAPRDLSLLQQRLPAACYNADQAAQNKLPEISEGRANVVQDNRPKACKVEPTSRSKAPVGGKQAAYAGVRRSYDQFTRQPLRPSHYHNRVAGYGHM